tara:strand:+ start:201 stop:434 length:234 start_codon:yes stop_codon:yes gene_type:complete
MVKKINSTDARQGGKGRPVLVILVVGLALIVIGYFVVGLIGYSTLPDGEALEPNTVRTESNQSDEVLVTPQESQAVD